MTADQRSIERLRLFAISLALTLGMVAQDAGRTAADTKLDLVVDPGRFLSQAVSMWDPLGEGGRLQNQAYGYLFPMGPFFAIARWLDIPAWASQRLWESALLVSAFLGMYCVIARTRRVAILAGGCWRARLRTDAEGAGGDYRQLGGVVADDGVAVGAAPTDSGSRARLPTSRCGPQRPRPPVRWWNERRRHRGDSADPTAVAADAYVAVRAAPPFCRWWGVALVLSTSWWVVPLLVLGKYSPPFLDWIEAAENTTVSTSLIAALRGAPHWVTYLGPGWWPAGWIYVATPAVVLATVVVAAIGLAGLPMRGTPHRLFLCASLATGLVAVTLGHAAAVGPVFDAEARSWLDGPLVAFRNVHKFQPLITMPLAVGFGVSVARVHLRSRSRATDAARLRTLATRFALAVSAVTIGGLAVAPALDNELVSAARDESVATWWRGAARWLAVEQPGKSRADRARGPVPDLPLG